MTVAEARWPAPQQEVSDEIRGPPISDETIRYHSSLETISQRAHISAPNLCLLEKLAAEFEANAAVFQELQSLAVELRPVTDLSGLVRTVSCFLITGHFISAHEADTRLC